MDVSVPDRINPHDYYIKLMTGKLDDSEIFSDDVRESGILMNIFYNGKPVPFIDSKIVDRIVNSVVKELHDANVKESLDEAAMNFRLKVAEYDINSKIQNIQEDDK